MRRLRATNRAILKVRIANQLFALASALAMMIAFPLAAIAQQAVVGVASVIDGDTIEIHGTRLRLYGIDAPESRQQCLLADQTPWRCGQQSAMALAGRLDRATISCFPRDRDRYGRVVAVCFKGGEDVNRWMVTNGWAVAFRRYALDYVADEDRARRGRLGLWSGSFDMPWNWRARETVH
jgi:endonuclease YncB( thermonuclease family)